MDDIQSATPTLPLDRFTNPADVGVPPFHQPATVPAPDPEADSSADPQDVGEKRRTARKWKVPGTKAIAEALEAGTLKDDMPIGRFYEVAIRGYLEALSRESPARALLYRILAAHFEQVVEQVEGLDEALGREARRRVPGKEPNPKMAPVEAVFDRYVRFFPGRDIQGLATQFWNPVKATAGVTGSKDDVTDEQVIAIMLAKANSLVLEQIDKQGAHRRVIE